MGEKFVQGVAFVYSADLDVAALFVGHEFDGSRR
jgi:hypothetical protein